MLHELFFALRIQGADGMQSLNSQYCMKAVNLLRHCRLPREGLILVAVTSGYRGLCTQLVIGSSPDQGMSSFDGLLQA